MKKLLLYGLQRSGTNYAEQLLRRRYRVAFLNTEGRRDDPRHKHFRLYDDKRLVPTPDFRNALRADSFSAFHAATGGAADGYLVICKHPCAWLLSYRRWASRSGWPGAPHHPLEEYTAFYGHWARLADQTDRVRFLRYEDLLADPAGALLGPARDLGLTRRRGVGLWPERLRHVPRSGRFTETRRAYYLRHGYFGDLSDDDLAQSRRHLPAPLLGRLGYAEPESARADPQGAAGLPVT